jgi:hypothetical protein
VWGRLLGKVDRGGFELVTLRRRGYEEGMLGVTVWKNCELEKSDDCSPLGWWCWCEGSPCEAAIVIVERMQQRSAKAVFMLRGHTSIHYASTSSN